MNPTDNSATSEFSTCSKNFMCTAIKGVGTSCLKRKMLNNLGRSLKLSFLLLAAAGVAQIQTGVCGNGVREPGEDCDCGAECGIDNCCDGTTCKFKGNAQCDDLQDDCCKDCKLLAKNTVCRQSTDICSFTQTCDGVNAKCPNVVREPDGKSCALSNSTGTTCASGICTSRDLQCRSIISTVQTGSTVQTVKQCAGHDSECSLFCETSTGQCLKFNAFFIGINITAKNYLY